uniref:LAGLIDADG_2 domain-containing protein n=1 Tax=Meloidogyne hapla TaxID=6305 RepID=A0A1I8BJ77_MELHA
MHITGNGKYDIALYCMIKHDIAKILKKLTFNLSYGNITNNVHWHSLKIIRRGQRMGLKLDGKWHNHNLEHLFRFHGDLRILSLNGHDLLRPIRVMKRQKGEYLNEYIY